MPKVDKVHTIGRVLVQQSQGKLNQMTFTREVGEGIVINGEIKVTLIEKRGHRVRLYIEAPGYGVNRTELGRLGAPRKSGGLVLSRNITRDEGIYIGDDILVEPLLVDARSNKVKIRTTLPRNMRIDRDEINEARLRKLREIPDEDSGETNTIPHE